MLDDAYKSSNIDKPEAVFVSYLDLVGYVK